MAAARAKYAPGMSKTVWDHIGITGRMHPSIRRRILEHNWFLLPYVLPLSKDPAMELRDLADAARVDFLALHQHLLEHDGPELGPSVHAVRHWLANRNTPGPKAVAFMRYIVDKAKKEG